MGTYYYEIIPTGFSIQIFNSETNELVTESFAEDEHEAWNWAEREIESWEESNGD